MDVTVQVDPTEDSVAIFMGNASPHKLMLVAKYMSARLGGLAQQHDSVYLEDASDFASDLILALAGAILDIEGARK